MINRAAMITPEMKVGTLLDTFPELESVLVEMAPAFKKLQNPILRKTVAKVATLEKAAGMANIPVRDLIIKLRTVIGQPTSDQDLDQSEAPRGSAGADLTSMAPATMQSEPDAHPPSWFAEDRVRETIDADAILGAGETPISTIVQSVKALNEKVILRVTIHFKPIPMIEMLEQQGFQLYCRRALDNSYELFICTKNESMQT